MKTTLWIIIKAVFRNFNQQAHLQFVLDHFSGVTEVYPGQHEALCPSHADQKQSLSIGIGDNGYPVLYCHASCETQEILEAVGLKMYDLYHLPKDYKPSSIKLDTIQKASRSNGRRNSNHRFQGERISKTYDYRDEKGRLLFQVVRYTPKSFKQRRPNGNGNAWVWNLNGTRRVLYKLTELIAADPKEPVFIVEGERDVETLRRRRMVATTSPGGACKWKNEFSKFFKRRKVVILPDNDSAGKKHAARVFNSLQGIADTVAVLKLPGLRKKSSDVTNWFNDNVGRKKRTKGALFFLANVLLKSKH